MADIRISNVERPDELETLRVLLREYAEHLTGTLGAENMDMGKYEQELGALPMSYEVLLLAWADEGAAGCALLKTIQRINEKACELKRLWVRPQFRGLGIGRKLTEGAMAEAKRRDYTAMYLDTVPAAMTAAHRMYQEMGFAPVERYNENPVSNVMFFRRAL